MNVRKPTSIIIALVLTVSVLLSACGKRATDKTYSRGVLNGYTYESEFLNLTFTAPDSYDMATEEYLNDIIRRAPDVVFAVGSDTRIDLARTKTVYEMMAANTLYGMPNVSLLTEKTDSADATEADYLDTVDSRMMSSESTTYTANGDRGTTTIAGEEYHTSYYKTTINDVVIYQDYAVRKVGNVVAVLLMTYTDDTSDEASYLLDLFQPIK